MFIAMFHMQLAGQEIKNVNIGTGKNFWLQSHKLDTVDNSQANLIPAIHLTNDSGGNPTANNQNNTIIDNDTNSTESNSIKIQRDFVAEVTLADTSNILEIDLKIGTGSGLNDIANFSFIYGDYINVPPTTEYSQNGNTIYLTFHDMVSTLPAVKKYCTVSIEKKDGKSYSYNSIITQ